MDTNERNRTSTAETSRPLNYLPAAPATSTEPGRVERFIANLLRRRGSLRPVARADDRR